MKKIILPISLFFTLGASAQLFIDNAQFFIDNGAVVTVQGDVTSNVDIQAAGTGKIRMGGLTATPQNLNMNGKTIPNLQIDNSTAPVVLTGAMKVTTLLEFTNGKMQLGNNDFTLSAAANYSGAGAGKFAETNGTGVFKKELTAAGSTTLPVGNGSNYTPLGYTTAGGTYNASTFVSARSVAAQHPNKHPRSTDYLNNYWKLSNNIAGASITAVGNYLNPASVTGNQADIVSLLYNGSFWTKGTSQAATSVTAFAPANASQDLYGMNKFILVAPKVFLQGTFDAATGLMKDKLRNSTGVYTAGSLPASNILPTTDPYRIAPYNVAFAQVANSVAENLTSNAVLNDLANPNDQIVDWVFVELRNKTSNTVAAVVATRSVLVQRDGDLVDIDGTSPVYFKNIDSTNNYVVSIRHRNHLGLSSNPANALSIGLKSTTFDFTNTANTSNFFGSAANYTQAGAPAKVLLWSGNVYLNNLSNYLGLNTDRAQIITVMANPGNSLTPSRNISTVSDYQTYGIGDLNFDRKVEYLGLTPDRAFLLSTVMSSSPTNTRLQALPN
ncbi:hypothetical protein BH10BAC3_BH10BAC3_01490 [soil metagenome]